MSNYCQNGSRSLRKRPAAFFESAGAEILWKRLAGETDWTSVQEVEKISSEIFEFGRGSDPGSFVDERY